MTNVLITGGAGFIGSQVCRDLLDDEKEYNVYCLDNFDPYYHRIIKEQNIAGLDINLLRIDLLDTDKLQELFAVIDPEYVIHLAAQPGVRASLNNPLKTSMVNVEATLNLLEVIRNSNVKKTVFASSSSVYGNRLNAKYGTVKSLDESQMLSPISPYGVSKMCCEHNFRVYKELYGMDYVGLRYFTVYGERIRPDLAIHKFTKSAFLGKELEIYGDGSKSRDLTYVGDASNATVLALSKGEGIYNIGGGHRVSVNNLANNIIQIVGKGSIKHVADQAGDVVHTLSNTEKARKELGWIPKTDFFVGLRKTVDWVIQNG